MPLQTPAGGLKFSGSHGRATFDAVSGIASSLSRDADGWFIADSAVDPIQAATRQEIMAAIFQSVMGQIC